MNNSEKSNEDILNRYINPGKVEKAPDGFTEKIMSLIQTEKTFSPVRDRPLNNYRVPAISVLITITLIITAILFSSDNSDSPFFSIFKSLNEIKLTFPKISMEIFSDINMPGWIVYLALAIFFLTLFDRLLGSFFQKVKK